MTNNFVITETDRTKAEGYNSITIRDMKSGLDVYGILQEKLQVSVEGNWDNLFGVSDRFDLLRKGASMFDVGLLNAGFFTRRYYKGGSYLKITPKFRMVDTLGDGIVVSSAKKLMNLALPSLDKDFNFKDFVQTVSDGSARLAKNSVKGVRNAVGELAENVREEGLTSGVASFVSSEVSNLGMLASSGLKQLGIGSNSPSPVYVEISNYFWNEFIIENVSVEFSKEMTASGPLYADFDVSLSTVEVTTKNKVGFVSNFNRPNRFEFR